MLFKAIFFAETAILRLIKTQSFINYTLGYNTFGYNFVENQDFKYMNKIPF